MRLSAFIPPIIPKHRSILLFVGPVAQSTGLSGTEGQSPLASKIQSRGSVCPGPAWSLCVEGGPPERQPLLPGLQKGPNNAANERKQTNKT